jgi:glycosyltransferase involved in cell wall biosynthesis
VLCGHTVDRWEAIRSALASVERQTVAACEIVFVADHNDDLYRKVKRDLPHLRVLANQGPRGAGGARNVGVSSAGGEIIAFLDDDAEAGPGWLEAIVRAHEDSRVLGVGGPIEPHWLAGRRPSWFPPEFDWVVGCTYPGLPETTSPVRNLIAANMSVRRDVFVSVGGFRDGFGKSGSRSGTEETELCIRASQRWPRRAWLFEPRMRVRHRVPAERSTARYFVSRCIDEGMAKAEVARFVGSKDGLASERQYLFGTIPRGIFAAFQAWSRERSARPALRIAAIVGGCLATGLGYTRGVLEQFALSRPAD